MSSGLSLYIILLTSANFIGVTWLFWRMRKRRIGDSAAGGDTTGHVWDGDLREYNNPLPRWWLWLFFATMLFAVIYLVLYPGMGSWQGTLGWTSAKQHAALQQSLEAEAQKVLAPFAGKSVEDLRHDPAALKVGRNLFNDNCILCHGSDAGGATGFPNLADKDWLWGGSAENVEATISNGRQAAMVAWKDVLGEQGVEDVLAYVLTLSGRSVPAGDVAHGKEMFTTNCIACHGEAGTGNPLLGAPNLTDNTWLYGGSVAAVRESIAKGRLGQMPAQGERLGEQRVKLLAAYVLSLGDANK
jgi:cytochrome c oxidase cbb3-type subunit 3